MDGWRKWEDNIKRNLQGFECLGMDWVYLAQDRDRQRAVLNTAINFRAPRRGEVVLAEVLLAAKEGH
jgi:hypothetical protein